MKGLLLLGLKPALSCVLMTTDSEYDAFLMYVNTYHKSYDSVDHFNHRFTVFKTNLQKIVAHNLNPLNTFTLSVNKFTDLTADEFNQYKGLDVMSRGCETYQQNGTYEAAVDWRNKSVVNAVKDQGACGSCWAFATVANAESIWAIDTGILFDLSEQQIVDCSHLNRGCQGGSPDLSFTYMIQHGLTEAQDYPYTSGNTQTNKCQPFTSVVSFSKCYDVEANDPLSLTHAVMLNPVVVAIEADTSYFQSYSSGIISGVECGTNLDHAVEIVGYGTDQGMDYWWIRNSWGEDWGESGYVRLLRTNSTNDPGICGVAMKPSFLKV